MTEPRADRLTAVLVWVAPLAALAWRAAFVLHRGLGADPAEFFDDALITLRYARNLAAGAGLVYNPGQAVLGTTTPLYALVMSLPSLAGLDLPWAAAILNAAIDAAIVASLVRTGRGAPVFQLLAAGLYILHPKILYFSGNGMELTLVVGLALLASHLFWRRRDGFAGVVGAAIVVCRIDGVLFVAALGLVGLVSRRAVPWRYGLAVAAGFAPWAAYAGWTYGSIIPASAAAKRIWYAGADRLAVFHLYPGDRFLVPLAAIGLVAALAGSRGDGSRRELVDLQRTLAAWLALFCAFFATLAVRVTDWYRIPQHLAILVLAAGGAEVVWRRWRRWPGRARAVSLAIALGLTVIAGAGTGAGTGMAARLGRNLLAPLVPAGEPPITRLHVAAGEWLARNAPRATVMAGNIGHIGWLCDCVILDDVGLISPEVLPHIDPTTRDRSPLIAAFLPDYLAFERRESDEMAAAITAAGYVLVARFSYSRNPEHGQSPYRIYARRDLAAAAPAAAAGP